MYGISYLHLNAQKEEAHEYLLKNMLVNLGIISPRIGMTIKHIWVATTQFQWIHPPETNMSAKKGLFQ